MCHAGHDRSHRSSIVMWPVLSHGKIGPAARAVGRETKTATRRAQARRAATTWGRPRGPRRGKTIGFEAPGGTKPNPGGLPGSLHAILGEGRSYHARQLLTRQASGKVHYGPGTWPP